MVSNKKRPLSTNLSYFFGGLSIAGALTTFLAGLFFALLGIITSIVAIKKHGESYRVIIPWSVGLFLNILVVIFIIFVGPIPI